jgi:hypothetical protein
MSAAMMLLAATTIIMAIEKALNRVRIRRLSDLACKAARFSVISERHSRLAAVDPFWPGRIHDITRQRALPSAPQRKAPTGSPSRVRASRRQLQPALDRCARLRGLDRAMDGSAKTGCRRPPSSKPKSPAPWVNLAYISLLTA